VEPDAEREVGTGGCEVADAVDAVAQDSAADRIAAGPELLPRSPSPAVGSG
jgi:hypothetical protein